MAKKRMTGYSAGTIFLHDQSLVIDPVLAPMLKVSYGFNYLL